MKPRTAAPRGLPARLGTFDAGDWPGRHEAAKYGAWMAARIEYADAHGLNGLNGDRQAWERFPDAPFDPSEV